MALRKIFTNSFGGTQRSRSGFTLIEILMVLAIVSMIISATLIFDINSYRGEAFRAERNIVVIALQTARANALNNINQEKHGVKINPSGFNGYVVFEGNDYASSDPLLHDRIPALYTTTLDPGSPSEVVFSQLSGDANFDGEIVLHDPERNMTANIVINHEGKIGW